MSNQNETPTAGSPGDLLDEPVRQFLPRESTTPRMDSAKQNSAQAAYLEGCRLEERNAELEREHTRLRDAAERILEASQSPDPADWADAIEQLENALSNAKLSNTSPKKDHE